MVYRNGRMPLTNSRCPTRAGSIMLMHLSAPGRSMRVDGNRTTRSIELWSAFSGLLCCAKWYKERRLLNVSSCGQCIHNSGTRVVVAAAIVVAKYPRYTSTIGRRRWPVNERMSLWCCIQETFLINSKAIGSQCGVRGVRSYFLFSLAKVVRVGR